MQFLYDNLTATVIALMTTLILLSIQSRATQNSVAEVSRNRMGELTQTFASWLERDIERMGENFENGERAPFDNPVYTEGSGGTDITTQFTFYRDSTTSSGDEYRIATRYEVAQKGTRTVDGTSKPTYQLTRKKRRKEMGTGSWSSWSSVKGGSPSSLGYFQIDLLDKDASPVSNPNGNADQVHSVRVRFSVVSPFQNAQTFPQATHVGSVLLVRDQSDASVISVPENAKSCTGGNWKQLTDGTGTPFGCAAACKYMASGGSKGSDNCTGGKGRPW
ncbi:hypothetical protein [Salinibacter ruber]|uniref:hypothetical protein n=1 Tax=Salinibacter ruber TaxID=146919 RepID=UPI002073BD53|nr:hypothetical protein [Salinibacter ruber]MCS3860806.1 hypothetical protein [Salinibacter ruber]